MSLSREHKVCYSMCCDHLNAIGAAHYYRVDYLITIVGTSTTEKELGNAEEKAFVSMDKFVTEVLAVKAKLLDTVDNMENTPHPGLNKEVCNDLYAQFQVKLLQYNARAMCCLFDFINARNARKTELHL